MIKALRTPKPLVHRAFLGLSQANPVGPVVQYVFFLVGSSRADVIEPNCDITALLITTERRLFDVMIEESALHLNWRSQSNLQSHD